MDLQDGTMTPVWKGRCSRPSTLPVNRVKEGLSMSLESLFALEVLKDHKPAPTQMGIELGVQAVKLKRLYTLSLGLRRQKALRA